jgi:hypothetical protein
MPITNRRPKGRKFAHEEGRPRQVPTAVAPSRSSYHKLEPIESARFSALSLFCPGPDRGFLRTLQQYWQISSSRWFIF